MSVGSSMAKAPQARQTENIDLHHNLTMNNTHRAPLARVKSIRMVNNLWYNHRFRTAVLTRGMIRGYHRQQVQDAGLRAEAQTRSDAFDGAGLRADLGVPGLPSLFLSGNLGYGQQTVPGDQYVMANRSRCEWQRKSRPYTDSLAPHNRVGKHHSSDHGRAGNEH